MVVMTHTHAINVVISIKNKRLTREVAVLLTQERKEGLVNQKEWLTQ
jgi:hypothetical protein